MGAVTLLRNVCREGGAQNREWCCYDMDEGRRSRRRYKIAIEIRLEDTTTYGYEDQVFFFRTASFIMVEGMPAAKAGGFY